MALASGTRLGQYEVVTAIGAGGMGEVYRATDTTLGRDVAIKVLPASVANDPERLARFEREAKLLASLSHANIAQIYGLENAGQRLLVMELAAGDDLSLRISRGAVPLDEALPLALQIAQALEAAHERGIVHRDLKPANIKVSDDGHVKVLDFGLAKALAPAGMSGSQDAMNSPTLTAQATAAGVILGTAAYMSPEQARGREADKRADVWAWGVVLFEMLTGARLFEGETISDTLAAVLRQDIPWARLPAGLPLELTRLLRRCLERDRKNRLHDIADARIVLEEIARGGIKEDATPAVAAGASGSARRTSWVAVAVVAIAMLGLGVLGGRWTAPTPAPASGTGTIRLVVPTPRGVTQVGAPAVAPDGRFVVFVGRTGEKPQLFVQYLDRAAPVPMARTEGASQPLVSKDGRWIVFRRPNRLEKIALDGGEPLPITDAPADAPGATWLGSGTVIFTKSWLGPVFSVSSDGGSVRAISTLDTARGEIGHWYPSALPDGRHALITVWVKGAGLNDAEVALLDTTTGQHRVLFKGAEGRYVAPGFIVFFRAGMYHAVSFDASTLTATGEPVRVLDDAFGNTPQGDEPQTDLSSTGTLAYLSGPLTRVRQLTWIASGGATEALPFEPRPYTGVSLTRDGSRAAVAILDVGRIVIHLLDLARRTQDVLDLPGANWQPVWHPDGKRLAFLSMRKGDFDTYWKDVTSPGAPEPLLVTDQDDTPESFLPDGKSLVVRQSDAEGRYLPRIMPVDPIGAPKTFVDFTAGRTAASADGQFAAVISTRSGVPEVYVVSLGGGAAAERVSAGGATAVAWSRNGRELFYLRPPEIVAVTFRVEGRRFRATGERVWARVAGDYQEGMLAEGPDGRLLVALARDVVPREIRVVINWQQEIAKKLGR